MATLERNELRPGMKVRNTVSGLIGELMPGRNPHELRSTHDKYVPVKVHYGKKKKPQSATWALQNIERA